MKLPFGYGTIGIEFEKANILFKGGTVKIWLHIAPKRLRIWRLTMQLRKKKEVLDDAE